MNAPAAITITNNLDGTASSYVSLDVAQAMAQKARDEALEVNTLEDAARHILMVENIDAVADACRRLNIQQEKFRAILSALKGGEK